MSSTVLGIADGRALGGSLRVVVTRPGSLRTAKAAVDEIVAAMDQAASRFREDSELSLLNASPDREVTISPLLAQAIAAALRGAELSGGAVDPTIGSAIRLAGYDTDFAQVPVDGDQIRLYSERVPGWRAVHLNPRSRTVRVPSGVELDLGATAKALTSDLAAAAASKAIDGAGVLVSLGGDIAVAGQAPDDGWSIQASEDSAAPIDDKEESPREGSPPPALLSGAGREAASCFTTSSTRRPASRRTAAGGPPASWRPPASTPTSHRLLRS
jgi:thiamine biosynthesis lipoprotein